MPAKSTRIIAILILLAVIIAIPVVVLTIRRQPAPTDPVTRMAYTSMRSDLVGLINAEQATLRIRGRFLADPEAAGHISSPGVTTPVIILSDTGWSATVGYKTIPGIRCGIGVYMRNPLSRLAKSGEIVCE